MRDPMAENPKYDLLLRGGRVICPASGINGVRDLAIRDGRIAAIEETILSSSARETIDVSGKLVLPGMIDTHAHVYQYVTGRRIPAFCHRKGRDAGLRLSLGVSGWRPRGPLLPQSLQPFRRRHRRKGCLRQR